MAGGGDGRDGMGAGGEGDRGRGGGGTLPTPPTDEAAGSGLVGGGVLYIRHTASKEGESVERKENKSS